jgi:hypothetical protein
MKRSRWGFLGVALLLAIVILASSVYYFGKDAFVAGYSRSYKTSLIGNFTPACINAGKDRTVPEQKQTAYCGCIAAYLTSLSEAEVQKIGTDEALLANAPQVTACAVQHLAAP